MNSSEEKDKTDKTNTDKMLDKASDTINWWTHVSTINATDPMWVGFLKILMRIFGIILLIIISPFAILGIIIAILTVF